MDEHFGEHFMLDGYGGDEHILDDRDVVLRSLEDILVVLDMHKLADPVVYRAEGNDVKDPGGWSGFVIIMESHISIHTFPKRGFVSIDAYTCKAGLNTKAIRAYFTGVFNLKDSEVNFVKRGTQYPNQNLY